MMGLIERLEAAPIEGSRELDHEICAAMDTARRHFPHLILDGGVPCYSTSLDAALPGENIVEMYRFGPDLKFRVRHSWGDGQSTIGEHKSEAIARRIAALKARAT